MKKITRRSILKGLLGTALAAPAIAIAASKPKVKLDPATFMPRTNLNLTDEIDLAKLDMMAKPKCKVNPGKIGEVIGHYDGYDHTT